jgi:invasion protein IalB
MVLAFADLLAQFASSTGSQQATHNPSANRQQNQQPDDASGQKGQNAKPSQNPDCGG